MTNGDDREGARMTAGGLRWPGPRCPTCGCSCSSDDARWLDGHLRVRRPDPRHPWHHLL